MEKSQVRIDLLGNEWITRPPDKLETWYVLHAWQYSEYDDEQNKLLWTMPCKTEEEAFQNALLAFHENPTYNSYTMFSQFIDHIACYEAVFNVKNMGDNYLWCINLFSDHIEVENYPEFCLYFQEKE